MIDDNPGVSAEWFSILPGLVPLLALSLGVGLIVSRPLGRILNVRRPVALAMILALGAIAGATLTPLGEISEAGGTGSCDFSKVWLELNQLRRVNDEFLNVLLFIPLGATIGVVPGRRPMSALIAAAIALPFMIETAQLLVPALGRGCESGDVVDNLTGLIIGLAIGAVAIFIGGRSWSSAT